MLTKRQLKDAFNCWFGSCEKCSCNGLQREHGTFDCIEKLAQTALALADMLEEITDTLDTVTDIIDESGEWGNINAQTTIETLDKAKALLKEMEGLKC